MESCLRTLGVSLANKIVIPAAWLSGLVTIGLVWGIIRFSPDKHQIRDFTWVTGWQFEWQQIDSRVSGGVLQIVDGAGMSVPTGEIRRRFIKFSLVLTVADTNHPLFRFPMNRSAAEGWCSRCNVLFKC